MQNSDLDILASHHRLILDTSPPDLSYGAFLFRKYYDSLYKDTAIIEFGDYRRGQIGVRWRSKAEVLAGKGSSECANAKCSEKSRLSVYEVNFKYREAGETKSTLVKVRTCMLCSEKLNFKYKGQPGKRVKQ